MFAVPHAAVAEIVRANASALEGKIIIDATNNFSAPLTSNIVVISGTVPDALIYRAFNSLGWEVFAHPQFGETITDHFFCGPDGDAREIVEQLITEVGVQPFM